MLNQQRFFAVICVLLLLISGGVVFSTLLEREGFEKVFGRSEPAEAPVSDKAESPAPAVAIKAPETTQQLEATLSLVPRLKEIPWRDSEIEQAYRDAASRSCRLLPAGQPVIPDRLGITLQHDEIETLRMSAVSVGLQVDPAARAKLPKVSKGTIENYLSGHRLLIQAEVALQADQEPEFTGNIYAAFYARSSPRITSLPESMIKEAVSKFRLLGILEEDGKPGARTLVLGFNYNSGGSGLATGIAGERPTFDLMFLHLQPGQIQGRPAISVFATAEGRSLFQEIEVEADPLTESRPAVLAEIRFNRFEMLGVYPADPVVTGIRNRARYTLAVEALQKRLAGSGASTAPFTKLLEELHSHPDPTTLFPVASDPMGK